MSDDRKLGVCIVGAGDMGTKHAERWRNVPEAEVVAVADIDGTRAEKLAQTHRLKTWYTDFRLAIGLPDVDVVSVCVPTCDHPEITIFAANRGKHVLCEKPIALTLAAVDQMVAAARQNRIKLGLGYMRRYSPITVELRAWLARGELGRPVMYHAVDVREIRPKREMHDARANGGPIIDMGVHLFDGWRFIFDSPPVQVFAQGLKLAQKRQELADIREIAYDTASIVVRYASGDIGSFVVSWGLPPGVTPPGRPDHILGPHGLAEVTYGITYQEVRVTRSGADAEVLAGSGRDMYQLEIDDFARAILDDRPLTTTAEDGRISLGVALAALKSIQSGRAVSLEN
jgi:predicted dehydrogenase